LLALGRTESVFSPTFRLYRYPVGDFHVHPRLRFLPFGLGDRALQVGEGPGREASFLVPVAMPEGFHSRGRRARPSPAWSTRLPSRSWAPLVGRAPPEFDCHRRPPLVESGGVLSGLQGPHLAGAGLVCSTSSSMKIVTRPRTAPALFSVWTIAAHSAP